MFPCARGAVFSGVEYAMRLDDDSCFMKNVMTDIFRLMRTNKLVRNRAIGVWRTVCVWWRLSVLRNTCVCQVYVYATSASENYNCIRGLWKLVSAHVRT